MILIITEPENARVIIMNKYHAPLMCWMVVWILLQSV